jgi:hypothetical protein
MGRSGGTRPANKWIRVHRSTWVKNKVKQFPGRSGAPHIRQIQGLPGAFYENSVAAMFVNPPNSRCGGAPSQFQSSGPSNMETRDSVRTGALWGRRRCGDGQMWGRATRPSNPAHKHDYPCRAGPNRRRQLISRTQSSIVVRRRRLPFPIDEVFLVLRRRYRRER